MAGRQSWRAGLSAVTWAAGILAIGTAHSVGSLPGKGATPPSPTAPGSPSGATTSPKPDAALPTPSPKPDAKIADPKPDPAPTADAPSREADLPGGAKLVLAGGVDARTLIADETVEPYVTRMSRRDVELRLQRAVPADKLAAAVAELTVLRTKGVRDWRAAEVEQVAAAYRTIYERIHSVAPGVLPRRLPVVKAAPTGEFPAAGYTVGTAVVIHERSLRGAEPGTAKCDLRFAAHELFHVLSRVRPDFRRDAYKLIGFEVAASVDWTGLSDRRLTNPDGGAPAFLRLKVDGREVVAVPALVAKRADFDAAAESNPLRAFDFGLFPATFDEATRKLTIVGAADRMPEPLGRPGIAAMLERAGQNTGYIIHPDEILADNFALWVQSLEAGKDAELRKRFDFRVPDGLGKLLAEMAKAGK